MSIKVFIDGSEGTTGLRIAQRMAERSDVELIPIDPALRKDTAARSACINASDITFLCLPDAAAVQAAELLHNDHTRIIDASTAHRTNDHWAYGFSELSPAHRKRIANTQLIANPGCHATGFISIVYPLVAAGALSPDLPVTCFSLTGYSGGGKKMIAQYEADGRDAALSSPRPYGLTQAHKHLPEMQKVCGLTRAPLFTPIVADYYAGMLVSVQLDASQLHGISNLAQLHALYMQAYAGQQLVRVAPPDTQANVGGFLAANALAGRDDLQIIISGNDDRLMVSALFDNLGKGASGAAIQNMNIAAGCEETAGLIL